VTVQPRKTRQKEAIRTAFVNADRPLSPEETLAYAQQQVDGISIATVYRNIGALVEDKWLMPVEIPGESTRYEVAGKEHHHHFHCNACGKVFEMQGCNIQVKPKLPTGFRVTGHDFFVYGVCAACH
jgi:Fur family transcriptional regulator, ferric uptake regulator